MKKKDEIWLWGLAALAAVLLFKVHNDATMAQQIGNAFPKS